MLIQGTEYPDIINGTPDNDEINSLAGDDTIFASAGNDTINGGIDKDTLDLQDLGVSITAKFGTGAIFENPNSPYPTRTFPKAEITSSLGQINSVDVEMLIAPSDRINTLDGSNLGQVVVDLEKGEAADTSNRFSRTTLVQNFTNVIGSDGLPDRQSTFGNDLLFGNSADNFLTGGQKFDRLEGKDGDDTLLGSKAEARGAGELDTLTGGNGSDRFILGDSNGAYYKTSGNDDLASITDFGAGDLIQLGTGDTYKSIRIDNGFDLFVTTDGANDLIAKVQKADIAGIANFEDVLSSLPEGDFTIAAGENLGNIFVGV
jgi:Ca2+-binding RTX toxin-like protein